MSVSPRKKKLHTTPGRFAQSSLEYLLLVAGAILVSTVILIMIQLTLSQGGSIVSNNLNTYASLGGNNSGNPSVCGNLICEAGEDCSICSSDCTCGLPDVFIVATDASAGENGAAPDDGLFTISRTGSLAQPLDVQYSISGSAVNGTDYATIPLNATIPANAASTVVIISPLDDSNPESTEDVTIALVDVGTYNIGSPNRDQVFISDDDAASTPSVSLSVADALAGEAGDPGKITITRSIIDTTPLVITIVIAGTATNNSDYSFIAPTVSIPANVASVDVDVLPIQDAQIEGVEFVDFTITPGAGYVLGSPLNGTVNIADDDAGASLDACDNYNSSNVNKPGTYPSYTSLFQQSWTWRRTLNPATDIDVGAGLDSASLVTSYTNAACGSTIVVHDLPLSGELDGFKLQSKDCKTNPIHIYFVNPTIINGGGPGGDVINIDNVKGLVIDGMNNLKVTTPQGVKVRAIFFIGHQSTSGPVYTATEKVVLKNMEVDGGYHASGQDGAKWGLFGDGNTDIAFCNMNVHDIWMEHGFYFHTIGGNFEIVKSHINNVGRTCMQIRDDWQATPSSTYVYADNECYNSCEGGALTADDPSGTWWVHGNKIAKAVQGFVSIDSQQQGYYDHRDGHVYFYDNKIYMGLNPIRSTWAGKSCISPSSQFQTRDGGASFYSQNNLFIVKNASSNIYFREYVNPNSTTHFPNILVESRNNTFANSAFGTNPANAKVARWDYLNSAQKYTLKVSQWQQTIPSIYKNTAYDLPGQSTYVGDPVQIQNLIDTHFSNIP